MSTTWIIVALILGFLVVFQIAKASEYVAILKGEERTRKESNRINAFLLLAFLIIGLIGVWYCNERLKDKILPEAASQHGERIDTMIWITLIITFIVFVITQVLLFWFAFKYQEKENRKAYFFPHDNRLEVIWTVVPAIVLTILVGFGLYYWFQITGDAPKDAQIVEVTGSQFKWEFRYPGKDNKLGRRYFKEINETKSNPLGQIWSDPDNQDDVVASQEMHIVVGKPVKLIIGAKDVIHDVGLAHFRLKMDAVPGIPTTMWFTPKYTTRQMKEKYGSDFNYEISCDQMCGAGHYGMRGVIVVESQAEFNAWLAQKQPQYAVANAPAPAATPATGAKADSTTANGGQAKASR
ncbi:MAG TPA: cytochrome c oxidase subunit II [Flavisolibacter sp.]|jgi:cytochrome c oxidase subunit 2|nr:cytochrome c oxidase subunit II [Flavisolibacter sp.]